MKFIYSESDQELLDKWDKHYDEYYKLLACRVKAAGYGNATDACAALDEDPFRKELFNHLVKMREIVIPVGIEKIK